MKIVILDNGHGKDTKGKNSPIWSDGSQLFEWEFNRDIVWRISTQLEKLNIPYHFLVSEDIDISLPERCKRANLIYNQKHKQAFLLSIHANAGNGTGWECWTSVGQTESDNIATIFCKQFEKDFPDRKLRFDSSDKGPGKEENFHILKNTLCPAVLTENFFMDTETDCKFIISDEGRQRIADFHVKAIKVYLGIQ